MFSQSWKEAGIFDPILNLLGSGNFQVSLPLDDVCDIDVSGSTSIKLQGDNPKTNLTISISGVGNITGNGSVSTLNAGISGIGNLSGFHIIRQLKLKVSGVSNSRLSHDKYCNVNKNVTGMSNVMLSIE